MSYGIEASLVIALGRDCLLAQPFFLRSDHRVGESPLAVLSGDFNGDGRPDLAVCDFHDGMVVLLNQGGGKLGRPTPAGISVHSTRPHGFMAADFNGDGKDDLVTTGGVFLSRGDGTFQPAYQNNWIVAFGDFNQDRKIDLIISERLPDIRNDGIRNWDVSMFKEFAPKERVKVQFRAEFLNAFNTPRFGGPNTTVTSSSSGPISSQANSPRPDAIRAEAAVVGSCRTHYPLRQTVK